MSEYEDLMKHNGFLYDFTGVCEMKDFIGAMAVKIALLSCLVLLVAVVLRQQVHVVGHITLMVERCSGGKVVVQYGHRKFLELDPSTNQPLRC